MDISASEAAARITTKEKPVSSRTVRRWCEEFGVGRRVLGVRVLTEDDLPRLREIAASKKMGNPLWTAAAEARRAVEEPKKPAKKRRSSG